METKNAAVLAKEAEVKAVRERIEKAVAAVLVDFRGLAAMRTFAPTIMDLTHSLQQPNQSSGVTGGRPELIAHMARTAIAAGADGVFIETHPDPARAKSDGANMLALDLFPNLVRQMKAIRAAYLEATL